MQNEQHEQDARGVDSQYAAPLATALKVDPFQELCDLLSEAGATVQFGLNSQGHLPTVDRMVAAGESWEAIGKAIGWCGKAARKHYTMELRLRLLRLAWQDGISTAIGYGDNVVHLRDKQADRHFSDFLKSNESLLLDVL
jgi:hypothetical protein